jgi:hypothetical protein
MTAASAGLSSCSAGSTLIGTAGKRGSFCIDTNQRAAATAINAKVACAGVSVTEGRAVMCNHEDWLAACLAGTPSNMTNDEELVADYTSDGNNRTVGSGSCTWTGFQSTETTTVYRCCIK